MKKTLVALPVFLLAMFVFAGTGSAHVKVHPFEVEQGSYETFNVTMPSEEEKAKTTKLELEVPKGVTITGVEPKAGWNYDLKKDDSSKITQITWKADNKGLTPDEFTELKMQGKVGDNAKKLTFRAKQTYSNGKVVKWIEDQQSEHPASVTKVVSSSDEGEKASSLGVPFYMSLIALILGVIAILLALFKRKKKD